MKVSIIVPVYNVEKYIYQCIDSLCKQTMKEIEIIVVDDGTEDNSISIVEEFNDSRIKIISQKNAGLSAARNKGLKVATGEYVAFVDSDDYIGLDTAYEEMYNILIKEESEMISGNALWYFSDQNNYPMERNMDMFYKSPMGAEEFYINSLKSKRAYAPVWLNLYKRNFLMENNLWFKEGIYHEDEEFTPRALLKAKNISIYDKEFYVYRQRQGSIMNSELDKKHAYDIFNICIGLENEISNIKSKELLDLLKEYLVFLIIEQIYKYELYNVSKEVKSYIKRNSISKGHKVRGIMIEYNTNLYILFEKIYRKIKRLK